MRSEVYVIKRVQAGSRADILFTAIVNKLYKVDRRVDVPCTKRRTQPTVIHATTQVHA